MGSDSIDLQPFLKPFQFSESIESDPIDPDPIDQINPCLVRVNPRLNVFVIP
jgi:hypothetical protein